MLYVGVSSLLVYSIAVTAYMKRLEKIRKEKNIRIAELEFDILKKNRALNDMQHLCKKTEEKARAVLKLLENVGV